jgi:phosphohistidine phosphatase
MLKLNLIRHAKTNQVSPTGRDFDRELLAKGVIQTNMLAVFLSSINFEPGTILCSSAKRTRQTWHILEQHLFPDKKADFSEDYYLANYPTLMEAIKRGSSKTITLIGHNEGISDLASYLTGQTVHLKTCGFIQLTAELENWEQVIRDSMMVADQYRPEVYFP